MVKNASAGFDTTWREIGRAWCEITLPTGRSVPIAESIEATVTAEIRMHPRSDAVAGNRLVNVRKGVSTTYLIEAALLDNETTMLRLLCSSVANP
jgi:head-tail adaptor